MITAKQFKCPIIIYALDGLHNTKKICVYVYVLSVCPAPARLGTHAHTAPTCF